MSIEVAWAAGLFEGEGCFTYTNSGGRRSVVACLNSTDKDVVEKFRDVVGTGAIYEYEPQKVGWKRQWHWKIGVYSEVKRIVELFYPYLCSRRRKTALRVLAQYELAEPKTVQVSRDRIEGIKSALRAGNKTQAAIAREFGVCPARVTQIKQKEV